MLKKFLLFIIPCLLISSSFAQRGKDGNINITSANTILNSYTYLTQNCNQGDNFVQVSNINGFSTGDLVLIIQMQGASLRGNINNNTWGEILSYNSAGLYEFQQVDSIFGNHIQFDCGLSNNYLVSGKTQVIRVPRYISFNLNNGASVTCPVWNGQTGGIVALEILNGATINGNIDVTGRGFRGGIKENWDVGSSIQVLNYSSVDSTYGAEKGEGIGGYRSMYDALGGKFGRGAPANGGGGGNGHNSGGGGGSNAGFGSWNGSGNPDNGIGNIYEPAWNLESLNFANNTSSGGGRGGYSYSKFDKDALSLQPGDSAWGGNLRSIIGGLGGRPLNNGINSQRIFLGGGGGAGDGNNSANTDGARGGGMVIIISYDTIAGTGNILANGNNGLVTPLSSLGGDAPGGGGGGGTIVLNAAGNISDINTYANGGKGGNQNITILEAEGPGGGGGGGYIASSNGTFNQQSDAGLNGTTNSASLSEFPPNGATKGADGLNNQAVTNFSIIANGATICAGDSITINASLTGNYPSGTTIQWYLTETGGSSIYTGSPYTTPILDSTTIFYVGTCPGTYRIPVTVTVNPLPVANAGIDTAVCLGQSTHLSATGGVIYLWHPAVSLDAANISNPLASPITSTTYIVTVTDINGCSTTDNVFVLVHQLPIVNAGSNQAICIGDTAQFIASGGVAYIWSTGDTSSTISVFPSTSTTYTATITDNFGCSNTDNVNLTIYSLPLANAGHDTTVCIGSGVQLTATGGTNYSWASSNSLSSYIISNPIASPVITTTYTVTVSDVHNCQSSADVKVTVKPLPLASGGVNQHICIGDSAIFNANGGLSYLWSSGDSTQSIKVSPITNTTYFVTVTDIWGCKNSDTTLLTVLSLPIVFLSNDTSICTGTSAQLNASGGVSYLWSPSSGLNANNISNPISSPSNSITYTVKVTDLNGCSNTDNVSVSFYPEPSINILQNIYNGCSPLQIQFSDTNLNNISAWEWNFGDPGSGANNIVYTQNPSHTYNIPGNYSIGLTLTTVHGCHKTAQLNNVVTIYPNPVASFNTLPAITNIYQPTITFENTSTNAVSYYWNFGDALSALNTSTDLSPTHTYSEETPYNIKLVVFSQYGCMDSCFREVIINPEFTFFIPNVFTPNGDGINDFFQGTGRNFTDCQMFIYDRWGDIIFESNDYNKPWDGKYNNNKGKDMQDVFIYKFVVKDFKGRIHEYTGHVTLLM